MLYKEKRMKRLSKKVYDLMTGSGGLRALLIAGLLVGVSGEVRGSKKSDSLDGESINYQPHLEGQSSLNTSDIVGGVGTIPAVEAATSSEQQTSPSQDTQKEKAATQFWKSGGIEHVKKQYPKTYGAIKGVYDVGSTVAGAPRKAAGYVGTKVGDMWTGSVKRGKEAYSWLGGKLGVRNREKEFEDIVKFAEGQKYETNEDSFVFKQAVEALSQLKEGEKPEGIANPKAYEQRLQDLLSSTVKSGNLDGFINKMVRFQDDEIMREKGVLTRMKEKLPSMPAFSLPKRKPIPITQLSRDIIKMEEEKLRGYETDLKGIEDNIRLLEDRMLSLDTNYKKELNNLEQIPEVLQKNKIFLTNWSRITENKRKDVIENLLNNPLIKNNLQDIDFSKVTDEESAAVVIGRFTGIESESKELVTDLQDKVNEAASELRKLFDKNVKKKEETTLLISATKDSLDKMKEKKAAQETEKSLIARLTEAGSKTQENFMTRVTGKTPEMRKLESQIKENDKMIRQAQKEYDLAKEKLRQDALDAGNAVRVVDTLNKADDNPANLNAVLSRLEANGFDRKKIKEDPEYRSVVIQSHKVMAEKFPLIIKQLDEKEQVVKGLRDKGVRLREELSFSVKQSGANEKQGETVIAERVTIEEGDDGWGVDRESQEIAREIEDQENNLAIEESKQDQEKGIVQQQKLATEFKQKRGERLIKEMVDKLSEYESGEFKDSDVFDSDKKDMERIANEYSIELPKEFSIDGYKKAFISASRNLQKMD